MAKKTTQQMADEVRILLQRKLRLRGATLEKQLRRGGRLLPRHVRQDAVYLAQTAALGDHPKLARLTDQRRLVGAHRNVVGYLNAINLRKKRVDMLLSMLAAIAFVVLVTLVLAIYLLADRGAI